MEDTYYTETTLITFGKHKSKMIYEVPADYLLAIHRGPKGCPDQFLVKYIASNIEKIRHPKWGTGTFELPKKEFCTKAVFPTKGAARAALAAIRENPGNNKKPVRSYECDKCSGWHLTSLPFEEWKETRRKEREKKKEKGKDLL